MDQLNFRNILLAYQAVHDDVLCESMDELGFFDDNIQLDEFMKFQQKSRDLDTLAKAGYPRAKTGSGDGAAQQDRIRRKNKIPPSRLIRSGKLPESYDLNELILLHLLDEGYADSVEGALAILENMSDEWLDEIVEERAPGVKPYRPNPTQAEIRERQRASKKSDDKPGYKDRSHIKAEGPLITARPGDPEEARKALKSTLPKGDRIMGPGFFPSRTADRVASITSSFTRGESPGGGDPQATRMPGERKPRRVIPSRFDKKK